MGNAKVPCSFTGKCQETEHKSMINNNKCIRIMSLTFLSLVNDQAYGNWSKLSSYCLSINLLVTDLLHNPSGHHFVNNLRQMENRDSDQNL